VVKSLGFLFYRMFRNTKMVVSLLALIFFPGVVIHELSHLLVAGVLFVPTYDIEFLPEIRGDTVKLGSVQIGQTDFFRRFLIGVAPVILGSIVVLLLAWYAGQGFSFTHFSSLQLLKDGGVLYGIFLISNTMFSSKKDLEGTGGFLLVALIMGMTIFFVRKSIYITMGSFLTTGSVLSLLQPLLILLAIPLAINILLTLLFYLSFHSRGH